MISIELTLDQVDALLKTVSIAKDNTARKMRDNMHQTSHRAYQTASDDFVLLHEVAQILGDAQARAYLA